MKKKMDILRGFQNTKKKKNFTSTWRKNKKKTLKTWRKSMEAKKKWKKIIYKSI